MNVTKEVIEDLLPVYLAGEASPATRKLVEDFMLRDDDLAQRVLQGRADNLAAVGLPAPPPDLELRSLRRTRYLLGWQKWLFGMGIFFTAMLLSNESSFEGWRLKEFHFLLRDFPVEFGISAALAIVCWAAYFTIRRRLRTTARK